MRNGPSSVGVTYPKSVSSVRIEQKNKQKRKAENGKRKAESRKRKAVSGKRKAVSGKRKAESEHLAASGCVTLVEFKCT